MSERSEGSDDTTSPTGSGLVGSEHLDAMLPFLGEAVYIYDRDGNLKARLSPPGGLLGYGAEVGDNVFSHLHPDDVPRGIQIGAEAQESQQNWEGTITLRLRHADGKFRLYELHLFNRHGVAGIDGMVARLREVTNGNGDDDDTLVDLGEDLPTAYLALGQHGRIRHVSNAAAELLGTTRDDLNGLPIEELVIDQDKPAVQAAYATMLASPGARTVIVTTRKRYRSRAVEAEFHTRGTDREHKVVTVVFADRSEEPELVRLATHDPLTGLANRTKVLDTIAGLLLEPDPQFSVVYVDLDGLKAINDAHGHEAGDLALVAVAQRLEHLVRPTDLVGRMGGDEFVVVCPDMVGNALIRFVQRIGERTAEPHTIAAPSGAAIPIAVSAGGASAAPGDTTSSLLRRADEAMFEAKRRPG